MSLYIFNVFPDHATISADTRMCCLKGDTAYRLDDNKQKLFVVNDIVVTIGGYAWLGAHIMDRFKKGRTHTVHGLYTATIEAVTHMDDITQEFSHVLDTEQFKHDTQALEICALQYDSRKGHNVFYHIATSGRYQLEQVDVDGMARAHARCYGGFDAELVQNYFSAHVEEVKHDYKNTLIAAYEAMTSEKIGGTLMVAEQTKHGIKTEQYPLADKGPILDYFEMIGHNIVGKNLIIEGTDINGEQMLIKADAQGLFVKNSRMYFESNKGGKIGLDAIWGIFGGTKPLFDLTGTGYVKPTFVGNNGKIQLDKDGMPINTNFLLGIDGNIFVRGTVVAESGKFNGDIYANNLYFNDGGDIKTLLSDTTKKIPSGLIDLGNIQLDGNTGDITMTGNINMGGNITMGGNIDMSGAGKITLGSGSISWNAVDASGRVDGDIQNAQDQANNATNKANDALDGVDDLARGRYIGGTFIDGKHIESPTITGGLIEGGELRVNGGVLSDSRGISEIGVYDQRGDKYGFIRYHDRGFESPDEAQKRMFICTEEDKALKIQSGGNMSLSAGGANGFGTIYIMSDVVFAKKPTFLEE